MGFELLPHLRLQLRSCVELQIKNLPKIFYFYTE